MPFADVPVPGSRTATLLLTLFAATCGFAEKVCNDPVYRVALDAPASNTLAQATFTKTVGGVTAPSSYAEFLAETAAGTLVKTGSGWLVIAEPLANWTGQIHVDEGVLQVTCKGGLGKDLVSGTDYASDADGTFVEAGAMLMMDSSLLERKARADRKVITFAGDGLAPYGGGLVAYARNIETQTAASGNQNWMFGEFTRLSGDATLAMDTAVTDTRVMLYPTARTQAAQYLDLGGYTLRIIKSPDLTSGSPEFNHNGTVISNGHIIVDGCSYHLQNEGTRFGGGAECSLTLTNKASFQWENLQAAQPPRRRDWTLKVMDVDYLSVSGSAAGYSPTATNDNCWQGPIEIHQPVFQLRRGAASGGFGVTFSGPISGEGGIQSRLGFANGRNIWLHLLNTQNAFQGGVALDEGVLQTGGNGSLPKAGGDLYLTNGTFLAVNTTTYSNYFDAATYNSTAYTNGLCRVLDMDEYELPGAIFAGTGLVRRVASTDTPDTRLVSKHKPGRWTGDVVKTGVGELDYDASFGGDVLDIRGGGVKISYVGAGLYESHVDFNTTKAGSGVFYNSNVLVTNDVKLTPTMAYSRGAPDWVGYTGGCYEGWLWNRTGADAQWSFAVAVNASGKVIIDGVLVCEGNNNGKHGTVTVGPGPHHFVLRMHTQSGVGGVQANYPSWFTDENTGAKKWPSNTCFFWDPQGRDKRDIAYYQRLEDPGDGSVVTLAADGSAPNWAGALPAFDTVKFGGAGTYLDLDGNNYSVKAVEGQGEIRNSNTLWQDRTFTIREKLTVSGTQAAAGSALTVAGTLVFDEGATIELADVAALPRTDITVAAATSGIVGKPTLVAGTGRGRKYRLEQAADGKSLRLTYHAGMTMSFR